ncbi:helix-turn-helix domain-containing protein [Changpingibacter yushuensis]|uniref:helix-turn-helix domain-containing protein n=1 Tax=Changpingibacter yushuensis TaxID=2758440 RepID=UPI0015F3F13D|nr:helix-turn-helix domain-containing protein [Changpingibacter yushuensis]
MANEATRAAASATARIVWDTADKFLRICGALDCQMADILEVVPADKDKAEDA